MYLEVIGQSSAIDGVAADTIYRISRHSIHEVRSSDSDEINEVRFASVADNPFSSSSANQTVNPYAVDTPAVEVQAYRNGVTIQLERWRSTEGFLFNAAPLSVTNPSSGNDRLDSDDLNDIEDVDGNAINGLATNGTVFRIERASGVDVLPNRTVSGVNSGGSDFDWIEVSEATAKSDFEGQSGSGDAVESGAAWAVFVQTSAAVTGSPQFTLKGRGAGRQVASN